MGVVITLTTDFGYDDAYVATMKGVILSINPQATIVDVCHSIAPQDIAQAAFVLSSAYGYFPLGAIHIAVVDPGVGSQRRAVLLITPSAFFLAPDNGILSYITDSDFPDDGFPSLQRRKLPPGFGAIVLTKPRFWRQPVSTTFHGRDIFAPVAAHLSLGLAPEELGEATSWIWAFPIPQPKATREGEWVGHIVHIDRFGNLITSIKQSHLPSENLVIEIAGRQISGLSSSYTQRDELLALVGSSGYLEIAARNQSASQLLQVGRGDKVRVSWLPGGS